MRFVALRLAWAVGTICFGSSALADEFDPRLVMSRALEDKADVSPGPPTLPDVSSRRIKAVRPAKASVDSIAVTRARAAAAKAAIRAEVVGAARAAAAASDREEPPWAQAGKDGDNRTRGLPPAHPGKNRP